MKNKLIRSLLLFCLVFVQLWFLHITFHYGYSGILFEKNHENVWSIKGFDAGGDIRRPELRVGDILEKVNGNEPNEFSKIKKWGAIEQADTITLSRNGVEFEIVIKDRSQPIYDFFSMFGEVISLFLSLLIYLRIPASRAARFLSLVFLITGIIFMSFASSYRGDPLAKVFVTNFVIALPLVFLHFLILFFKEKSGIRLSTKWLNVLYYIAAANGIATLCFLTPFNIFIFYKIEYLIVLSFFLLGLLLNLFMFVYIYVKYRHVDASIQSMIKIVWFALFVSCAPLAFLSFIPILVSGNPIVDPLYTGYCVILFPISFCYLIVTKQLFDIQTIMRRIVFTTLIAIVPSVLLVGLLSFVFIHEASLQNLAFSFLFILTTISFLLYMLEYFATRLEVIMFPRKYHLQLALKKVARNLRAITSFQELKEIILLDIVRTLQVYGGAIVFCYQNDTEMISEGELELEAVEQGLLNRTLSEQAYTVLEINRHEEYTSYFVFTKKKTNTPLGIEEKQWLDLIISYLAVSLENVYLIRKLTLRVHELASQIPDEQAGQDFAWLRKSLFALQERERFRIATDLHDTIIQDIVLIRRKLIAYIDNHTSDQPVQEVVKHLEMLNESLRQSCFELNPYLLQRAGLIKTMEAAIDLDRGLTEVNIHFQAEGTALVETLDPESKKHLFRIFQELMNNAKKHSQATEVHIRLSAQDSSVCLSYRDNGIGLDPARLDTMPRFYTPVHAGVGLEQMRSRVLLLGGLWNWRSEPGSGVELTIRIPLPEQKGWVV